MTTHSKVSFPWQVHAALGEWGARSDRKASALLANQGGAFLLAASLPADRWTVYTGVAVVFLVLSLGASVAVLFPTLGSSRRLVQERWVNLIYFGHVRSWSAPKLATAMATIEDDDELSMLSAQLVALSRIAWRKNRLLQLSLGLMLTALLFGVAALMATSAR